MLFVTSQRTWSTEMALICSSKFDLADKSSKHWLTPGSYRTLLVFYWIPSHSLQRGTGGACPVTCLQQRVWKAPGCQVHRGKWHGPHQWRAAWCRAAVGNKRCLGSSPLRVFTCAKVVSVLIGAHLEFRPNLEIFAAICICITVFILSIGEVPFLAWKFLP